MTISKREAVTAPTAGRSYQRDDGWRALAACRDSDAESFFPEGQGAAIPSAVKRTCAGCPVRRACLDFALTHHVPEGVWGGVGPADRHGHKPGDDIPIRLGTIEETA